MSAPLQRAVCAHIQAIEVWDASDSQFKDGLCSIALRYIEDPEIERVHKLHLIAAIFRKQMIPVEQFMNLYNKYSSAVVKSESPNS
jgi:hypothetical protein